MDVSIIVVSYNTRDLLAESLGSVRSTVTGLSYEVLVVDNGSEDGSLEMVARAFPEARLIVNSENRGFAAAVNQALAVARGRYALLLNSDAVLLEHSVSALLGYLDAHPESAIAGGQLLHPDGSFQGSYADFPTLLGELMLAAKLARFVYGPTYPSYSVRESRQERSVDWVSGALMLVRMDAFRRVGGMDESFFMYSEETDWCFRMREAGWQVGYEPTAKAVHLVGQSARVAPARRRAQIYRSKWLFIRKHRGLVAASVFRGAIRVLSALKLAVWALYGVSPNSGRRERAGQQVRSYAVLLGEL